MRKILQIALVLLFPTIILFSQSEVDSLRAKLNSAEGKERVDLLLSIADRYFENKIDEAENNTEEALKIAGEINYTEGIVNSHYLLGKIFFKKNEFVLALKNYDAALAVLSDSIKIQNYAPLVTSISDIYLTSGIYDKALENYIILLNYYISVEDKKGQAFALSYIGETYIDLQNSQNALKYLNQALEIAEDIQDEERVSFVLNSIGGVYVDIIKDYDTAEAYYKRALALSQKINYTLGIAKGYHNLGLVYYYKKDLNKALDFHKKSLDIVINNNIGEGLAYNYNSIARIYLELNQINSAINYFKKSLEVSQKQQITLIISENYKGLADSFKKKKDYKAALRYLELYNVNREKLNNEKTAQRIAELETHYEVLRKESENEILKRSNTIQRNYFIFSLVLGLIILIILFNMYWVSRKSRIQLVELNATKDKLFSIIGHDLKNPFGTLINFSEMLIDDYLEMTDEEKITYLHMINEASQTGHEILDNLLQWSKTQSGKLEFAPQYIELSEIVDTNISLLKTSASNKGISIHSTVNGNSRVFADKIMLKTVLRNLIGNAIKFSHSEGTINISSGNKEGFIEVVVSDNGVGMSREEVDKLFNPSIFHSTTGTANEQGTGLGLLLCKEFVEKNGGKIWVESEMGKGSDFKFTVPVKENSDI